MCAECVTWDEAGSSWSQTEGGTAAILNGDGAMQESRSQEEGLPALRPKISTQITADIMSEPEYAESFYSFFLHFQGYISLLLATFPEQPRFKLAACGCLVINI